MRRSLDWGQTSPFCLRRLTMKSHFVWFVAAVGFCLQSLPAGLVLGQADADKPPAPIALHFHEGPILLGPHENAVAAIAFSPDGATVATGGDGQLRIWDVK